MAKFKMRMKLTGFELELEGERADIPVMAANLGQQFSQLLVPAANIADGTRPRAIDAIASPQAAPVEANAPGRRSSTRRVNGLSGKKAPTEAVDFTHDTSKWGNPLQSWNPTSKAIWLLHVVECAVGTKELAAAEISATFNKHFKAFGRIITGNVSRDLKKSKSGANALFIEDSDASPHKWSLARYR